MRRRLLLFLLLLLPVIFSVLVFGLYFYKFGTLAHPTLSPSLTEWGQFGDYVGGTLGTYFALLAFCAAWLAVWFQHEQLLLARARVEVDELQRLMAYSAEQVDDVLYAQVRPGAGTLHAKLEEKRRSVTLHELISAAATLQLRERQPFEEVQLRELLEALRQEGLIVIRLQHLVRALQLFRARGGSPEVEGLYRERYQVEVYWLHIIDLLSSDRVRNYFQPERLAEFYAG